MQLTGKLWPEVLEVDLVDGEKQLGGSLAQCQKHSMGQADISLTQKLLSTGAIV